MTKRKKFVCTGLLGVLSLLASATAFVLVQVFITESFWLHAVAAPLNPAAIFQPTSFSYMGAVCQFLCGLLLLAGIALLILSAYQMLPQRPTLAADPNPEGY